MPDIFRAWDQRPGSELAWPEVVRLYERGYAGARYSRDEKERWRDAQPTPRAADVCHAHGLADAAAGRLVAAWALVERLYPGCWPASPQREGSCVAHADRNQKLTTLCGEVALGLPDEISGKLERAPRVSPASQRDGVLAWEPAYQHRGHRGDGWYCAAAVRVATSRAGAVARRDYPGVADLTENNSPFGTRYWRPEQVPAEAADAFDNHLFRESTEVDSFEELRDLLDRGFGVTSCGSEGFSDRRDENGVSRRQGRWAHAMAYIGADDRPETRRRYGGPLVLVLNSWGPRWNSGPRRVLGTDSEIPPGSFWAKWRDLARRDAYALSGLDGWERKPLTDWLGGW